MRIVLLNPPVPSGRLTNRDLMGGMGIDSDLGVGLGRRFLSLLKNEGTRMPVLALASAAALLKSHDVVVLDLLRFDPKDPKALAKVVEARPDWVVAATSFGFLGAELAFLSEVKRACGAKRLLLGYASTYFAQTLLAGGHAEAVSSGDAEVAVQALADGSLADGRAGLVTLGSTSRSSSGFVEDLDALPFPDWSGFPIDDYQYFPLLKKRPFVTLLSSRGCPYGCHFCPYPIAQGTAFRARKARNVVDEMQYVVEKHGVKSILFRDPTFSLDLARTKEICRDVLARKLKVEWGVETRLDRMDDEMVDLLAEAGCRSVEFGLDPLDEHTREASRRRGFAPEKAARLIARMEGQGIAAAGLFVIGIPGMTRDEMTRTIAWIESLEMSYVNYEVATPFPGTALYDQAVREGWTKPPTFDDLLLGDPKLSFNGLIDGGEIKKLQDEALSRFYHRPRKIAREIVLDDPLRNLQFFAKTGFKFLANRFGRS